MNIKTAPANILSIDELIRAQAFLSIMLREIMANGFEDGAMEENLRRVNIELDTKLEAARLKELQMLKAQEIAITPRHERRQGLQSRIAELEAKLGITKTRPSRVPPPAAGEGIDSELRPATVKSDE